MLSLRSIETWASILCEGRRRKRYSSTILVASSDRHVVAMVTFTLANGTEESFRWFPTSPIPGP
jgi:hypothetical protein